MAAPVVVRTVELMYEEAAGAGVGSVRFDRSRSASSVAL